MLGVSEAAHFFDVITSKTEQTTQQLAKLITDAGVCAPLHALTFPTKEAPLTGLPQDIRPTPSPEPLRYPQTTRDET